MIVLNGLSRWLRGTRQKRVFISYDTRESPCALLVKEALERRIPSCSVFVALRDIRPGEAPLRRMLDDELRSADAVVPICSPWSKTSPWLWWETSATWARGRKIFPLFLGIGGNDFGPPLSLVAQGRPFDEAGLTATFAELMAFFGCDVPDVTLESDERSRLLGLVSMHNSLIIDVDGASCIQRAGKYSLRRVRIANDGTRSLEGVEVMLEEHSPQGSTILPVRLKRMHEDPHPFTLNPGAYTFIDVVQRVEGSDQFVLCFEQKQGRPLPNQIAIGKYLLTLKTTISNAAPVVRKFVLNVEPNGEPSLLLAD